jgi:predicted ATPase
MRHGQPRHNLPAPGTRLVGRDHDIAGVREALVQNDGRLVTLTGAGGCGKTRLALAAAAELTDDFEDGVWLVELAPLVDPLLVPAAIALPLGLRESPDLRLLETLAAYLGTRSVLLILDNCEHLIEASARLAEELLGRCPRLRILVTSREPLRIGGEVIWSVPPLSTPDEYRAYTLQELGEYPAVQLFVERVQASRRGFSLTPENAVAVGHVCARLAGRGHVQARVGRRETACA